ncbi:hypothetical protein ACJ5H2_05915 [Nocardioides sp. R1-1]|uniref:hypothetical protein n=1 Tax=Nocardioides sp. R1-1 TaxID=3383502 RepID=UPI0038CFEA29
MAIKIEKHTVAFLKDGQVVEHDIEVYGVDRLRAELEGRRQGIQGQRANTNVRGGKGTTNVELTDMGDMLNRKALDLWAACVRLGLYEADSRKWRTEDFVGSEEHKDEATETDPTQQGPSTGAA